MSLISIVVPVYFNGASLRDLKREFDAVADSNPCDAFEFVFVDDGSQDDSWAVIEEMAADDSRVSRVRLSRNFGSNAAILAGISHATGDAVAVIAADLQDPPALIHDLIGHWKAGR